MSDDSWASPRDNNENTAETIAAHQPPHIINEDDISIENSPILNHFEAATDKVGKFQIYEQIETIKKIKESLTLAIGTGKWLTVLGVLVAIVAICIKMIWQ